MMVDNDKFLLEKTGFSESYVSETGAIRKQMFPLRLFLDDHLYAMSP